MATIDVYGLGVRSTVHVVGENEADLCDAVRAAWSRCLTPVRGALPGRTITVSYGMDSPSEYPPGVERLHDPDRAKLLQNLTQVITRGAIDAQRGRALMFHAGAVTDPTTGAALVYVAKGGTGKTTLSRRLGLTHGYVTDETVAILPDRSIVPYEKPLSVRPPRYAGTKIETSPDELGLLRVHPDAHIGRIALLDRTGREGAPELSELSIMDAITRLVPDSSSLAALPRPLHHLADLLDSLPPTLLVRYREGREVEDALDLALREAA